MSRFTRGKNQVIDLSGEGGDDSSDHRNNSDHHNSSEASSIQEELSLIQRQVDDLTDLVQTKDKEISELRKANKKDKKGYSALQKQLDAIQSTILRQTNAASSSLRESGSSIHRSSERSRPDSRSSTRRPSSRASTRKSPPETAKTTLMPGIADGPDYGDEEGDAAGDTARAMFSESLNVDILAETQGGEEGENFFDDMEEEEEEEDPPNFIEFDPDTFSLMMLAPVFSRDWALGMSAVTFQWMILALILYDQVVKQSSGSSTLNIPYAVERSVTFGQFLGIVICVGVQSDVLSSIQLLIAMRPRDESDWHEIIGVGEEGRNMKTWFIRVFLVNMLKFTSGILVLSVNFVTIVQSENIVDLMKDVAALLIVSELGQIFYTLAEYGFLGNKLDDSTYRVSRTEVEDFMGGTTFMKMYIPARLIVFLVLVSTMASLVGFFVRQQISGKYFFDKFPYCTIDVSDIPKIGDGYCNGGQFNSIACAFDGGDCIDFNLEYPNCKATEPELVGNDFCNFELNNEECNFDGSDCCPFDYGVNGTDDRLGDGVCHGGKFFTQMCSFDEFDCQDLRSRVQPLGCDIEALANLVGDRIPVMGDGICDSRVYNRAECLFEDGDCVECNDQVYNYLLTGDGICHGGNHNNRICNFDAGDCNDFNRRYPRCVSSTAKNPRISADLRTLPIIGDGICNSGIYNTADCGFEDGDCLLCNQLLEETGLDRTKLGDGQCDGQNYMSETCGMDGGDCAACPYPRFEIGNGWCTPEYNIPECGFDGGDCEVLFNLTDCNVEHPSMLGNGYCNGGEYGSAACGYDAGDCKNSTEVLKCPDERTFLINDGKCDGFLNNAACSYDGSDCDAFNEEYPGCEVEFPDLVGNGWCSGGNYNTEACKWDGGDCLEEEE